jgi:anti-anti-sigma regulatory factor
MVMNITTELFRVPDATEDYFRLKINGRLTIEETNEMREIVSAAITSPHRNIYIDASNVIDADLSGVNEVINAHYLLGRHYRLRQVY